MPWMERSSSRSGQWTRHHLDVGALRGRGLDEARIERERTCDPGAVGEMHDEFVAFDLCRDGASSCGRFAAHEGRDR